MDSSLTLSYHHYYRSQLKYLKPYPIDYMILGQHFFNNEYDGYYAGDCFPDVRSVKAYARILSEGIRTGVYTYVAHPDLVNYNGDPEEYCDAMGELFRTSLETDTPLEINLLGIRGRRQYPKEKFWEMVGSYGCKVVCGSDAHSPAELLCTEDFDRAMEMVDKYGLNYIEEVNLRSIF